MKTLILSCDDCGEEFERKFDTVPEDIYETEDLGLCPRCNSDNIWVDGEVLPGYGEQNSMNVMRVK
jgi:Zn finger protein HypA/HybF involved in hydrogenase expression